MVALLPADPEHLAIAGGVPAGQMHLTLTYLGDDVTGWASARREALERVVWAVTAIITEPIQARVIGHATFNPDGHDSRQPCAVYLIADSNQLAPTRDHFSQVCAVVLGEEFPTQHEPFLPHITAAAGATASDLSFTGPVVFGRVALALAGDWTIIPLTTGPVTWSPVFSPTGTTC
jgi:2'-5' RNA ligase